MALEYQNKNESLMNGHWHDPEILNNHSENIAAQQIYNDDWLGESIPFERQAQVGLGRGVGVFANLGECPDALFLPLERVAWVDEFSEFGQSGPSACGVAAYQRVAEF